MEIGIRLAIGAGARDITRLLIGEVAGLLVSGCAAGAALLFLASKIFASLIAGIASPGDPWPIAVTFAVVAFVSLLALWLPLRRATSIDPLSALRSE
jgi:ABC-type antimicrobial peptide transport system permease subunit